MSTSGEKSIRPAGCGRSSRSAVEQERHGESTAARVTGNEETLGVHAVDERNEHAGCVLDTRRKGNLGREAVVGDEHGAVRLAAKSRVKYAYIVGEVPM